jgi:WD40 repeat protein
VADLCWHPRGRRLAAGHYGGVSLLSLADGPAGRLERPGSLLRLAWSPDGRHLAAGAQDACVHVWVMPDGRDMAMSGYATKVRELAWDAGGRRLATGGGAQVTVWDFAGRGPQGTRPLELATGDEAVTVLAFAPAGRLLAAGLADGRVSVWEPGRRRAARATWSLPGAVSALAWSPRARAIAAGTEDGALALLPAGQ